MFVWEKNVPPDHVPAWSERLEFLGPERLAVVERPGRRQPRLEVYLPTAEAAEGLTAAFGGRIREVLDADWHPAPLAQAPLRIAGRLTVTNHPDEAEPLRTAGPTLCIPAAMAFGTGDHATTAMCLRLLAEVAHRRRRDAWEALDLGAGSGILALAARMLGATRATGFDNDPHAVRTARENAAANGVRAVAFRRVDLLRGWTPGRTWEVVAANLFSGLILHLLPQMTSALAPGGDLILSGILAVQADGVESALRQVGFKPRKRRKGRWVAFHGAKNL